MYMYSFCLPSVASLSTCLSPKLEFPTELTCTNTKKKYH